MIRERGKRVIRGEAQPLPLPRPPAPLTCSALILAFFFISLRCFFSRFSRDSIFSFTEAISASSASSGSRGTPGVAAAPLPASMECEEMGIEKRPPMQQSFLGV